MTHRIGIAIVLATLLCAGAGRATTLDETLANRRPEAMIDLATREGVALVNGEWRFSDTKIIQIDFKAAGSDGQPTGPANKAYDFTPHAGGSDFDDSQWEVLDPITLDKRRSAGRLAFNWYRIHVIVPESIGTFDPTGSTIVFETSVDDYAEIWVDGELPRAAGQSGGSVIKGWNAPNRLVIARGVKPGQKIQLAIFGINGPISNPPTNYIYMRYAKIEFHKVATGPVAVAPHEVNVEVMRLDPAIDAIVPRNPKIFKLAEGFQFIEAPVWVEEGYLLFSDRSADRVYRYVPDGGLSVIEKNSGHASNDDVRASRDHAIETLKFDRQGNVYVAGSSGVAILSPAGKHLGTIVPPKRVHNIAWGGPDGMTLYITARGTLYRMPLNIPGILPGERQQGRSLR